MTPVARPLGRVTGVVRETAIQYPVDAPGSPDNAATGALRSVIGRASAEVSRTRPAPSGRMTFPPV